MPFTVYILYSLKRDRYYVGHTGDDLQERLRKHNSNHKGFSGGVGDWEIVYAEAYLAKTVAYQREREIKAWKSRKKIELLIVGQKGFSSFGSEYPDLQSGGLAVRGKRAVQAVSL